MPAQAFGWITPIDLLMLISGAALAFGGTSLIVYGSRMRSDVLARRVGLVHPQFESKVISTLQKKSEQDTGFIRFELQGVPARQRREAARRLAEIGVPARYASIVIIGSQFLFAVGTGVFGLIVASRLAFVNGSHILPTGIALLFCILGWFGPSVILRALINKHAKAVAEGLPDALELLVICAEAGLALEDSIERTIGELQRSQPELAAELALTSADLRILPNRDEAFANLAERVDVPSVRSVVVTLSQTLRYGTPFAQALRVVAADMRTESLINLEDRANRLPALMTVPMMLFIMPTILLIVGGPAVLRLLDALFR